MPRTPYIRTLRDMARDQSVLVVKCRGCRHEKVVCLLGLIERFGPDKPISQLPFRCGICGGLANVSETMR